MKLTIENTKHEETHGPSENSTIYIATQHFFKYFIIQKGYKCQSWSMYVYTLLIVMEV